MPGFLRLIYLLVKWDLDAVITLGWADYISEVGVVSRDGVRVWEI